MLRRRFRRTRAQPRRQRQRRPAQSTTVTSSAAFPSALVGAVGGFSVLINGVQYTSAILTSTSSMTLATPYAGSTGSVTVSFNAVAENVQAGTPGSGFTSSNGPARFVIPALAICSMCRRSSCPQRRIHRQTTKRNTFWATIARMVHRWDVHLRPSVATGDPDNDATTLAAICTYNAPGAIVPPNTEAYSKPQIDARFPSCTSGQSYYFASDGQQVACLNFGSGPVAIR